MEDSNRERDLNDNETKEKQRETSIPENKNPYFDTSSSDSDFEYEFSCEICCKTFSGMKPLRQHEKGAQHLKRVRKKEIENKLVRNLEDSAENKEDDLEQTIFAVCKTCKKDSMGPESLEQHLKSSNHKKKMAASKLLKMIRDEDGHINIEKLREKRKEKKSKGVPIVVGKTSVNFSNSDASEFPGETNGACGYSGPPISSDDSSDDDTIAETHEFECLDCKKVFTGVTPWYQHLVSKVHEETLKQKELFDKLRITGSSLSKESSADQYLVQEEEEDVISCRLCNVAFSGPESARAHLKSKKHTKNLELKKWKKSMKENREGMKNISKVKKRAYSESSVRNSSEVESKSHEQETTGKEIDQEEDKLKFSKSEELSFGHDGYKSVSEVKLSPTEEKDPYLESSKATEDSSGAKRKTDLDIVNYDGLQNEFEVSATCINGDSSEITMNQEKPNLQTFQETYI